MPKIVEVLTTRDVTTDVDFFERHTDLVFEAPRTYVVR